MQVQDRPIGELRLYERNAKQHPSSQIDALEKSITEFGWTVPVLIDKDDVVVAGHGRIEAAKRLGIEQVPTIRLENLTPDQARAYRIADNRLNEIGGWDLASLETELNALREVDFNFDLTGFDSEYLEALSVNEEAVTKGDKQEPWLDENPVISQATAKDYPTAIIRFQTEEARAIFDAWLETVDHSIRRAPKAVSVYMPAKEHEKYNRE